VSAWQLLFHSPSLVAHVHARPASKASIKRMRCSAWQGIGIHSQAHCNSSNNAPVHGRGALATINSVIANAACPERLLFHVPSLDAENRARWATSMQDTFENVHLYQYDKVRVKRPVFPVSSTHRTLLWSVVGQSQCSTRPYRPWSRNAAPPTQAWCQLPSAGGNANLL